MPLPFVRRRPPVPKLPFKARAKRQAIRLVKLLVFLYLLIGIMLALFQSKLIFIGASTQGTDYARLSPPTGSELVHLKAADGTPITGLFARSFHDPARQPTVLFFYGNAMCMSDAVDMATLFRQHGPNVMLVDYEGYGLSGGKPSEQGCYAAAEAAYQHLLARTDIDTQRIIPAGWSLGAAVAIDLAARHADDPSPAHIVALMTFSAFTSMTATAQHHYPIFPVSLLLIYRFDSLSKMGRVHVPMLMVHGAKDDIVPYAMHAQLVNAARAGGATVADLTLEDAAHNDLFDSDEETLDAALTDFLRAFQP
ncbi:MAG TPA: alpha/beta hydrolase [Phycisphaerae bacterium]|nr:alpha/beta hydrolase [Phycisphaerae bacterium]